MCDDTTMKRILQITIWNIVQLFEKRYFCLWDETIFFCDLQKIYVGSKHLFAPKIFSIKSSYMHKSSQIIGFLCQWQSKMTLLSHVTCVTEVTPDWLKKCVLLSIFNKQVSFGANQPQSEILTGRKKKATQNNTTMVQACPPLFISKVKMQKGCF